MAKALSFDDNNFEQEVISSELPVLVDFWADWCGPCKVVGPVVEDIAKEFMGKVKVGKLNINTDNSKNTASAYGIMSVPTLIMFKGGKVVDKLMGAVPKTKLKQFVEKNI